MNQALIHFGIGLWTALGVISAVVLVGLLVLLGALAAAWLEGRTLR